ncbi:hypothetical protein T440DRAFT_481842 [Plenodomus tracheiphilus IPT5]|uniref:Uncharacterized protein n=1 Tax=Plenodomus tracheiphilus IPT5 TaxID=1408161 RepID=A0A6A7AZ39_9PLEO|nr:hypothetical protein T440DRAFT_481842 [Plenodomus tracheiphilus IPT5]
MHRLYDHFGLCAGYPAITPGDPNIDASASTGILKVRCDSYVSLQELESIALWYYCKGAVPVAIRSRLLGMGFRLVPTARIGAGAGSGVAQSNTSGTGLSARDELPKPAAPNERGSVIGDSDLALPQPAPEVIVIGDSDNEARQPSRKKRGVVTDNSDLKLPEPSRKKRGVFDHDSDDSLESLHLEAIEPPHKKRVKSKRGKGSRSLTSKSKK